MEPSSSRADSFERLPDSTLHPFLMKLSALEEEVCAIKSELCDLESEIDGMHAAQAPGGHRHTIDQVEGLEQALRSLSREGEEPDADRKDKKELKIEGKYKTRRESQLEVKLELKSDKEVREKEKEKEKEKKENQLLGEQGNPLPRFPPLPVPVRSETGEAEDPRLDKVRDELGLKADKKHYHELKEINNLEGVLEGFGTQISDVNAKAERSLEDIVRMKKEIELIKRRLGIPEEGDGERSPAQGGEEEEKGADDRGLKEERRVGPDKRGDLLGDPSLKDLIHKEISNCMKDEFIRATFFNSFYPLGHVLQTLTPLSDHPLQFKDKEEKVRVDWNGGVWELLDSGVFLRNVESSLKKTFARGFQHTIKGSGELEELLVPGPADKAKTGAGVVTVYTYKRIA